MFFRNGILYLIPFHTENWIVGTRTQASSSQALARDDVSALQVAVVEPEVDVDQRDAVPLQTLLGLGDVVGGVLVADENDEILEVGERVVGAEVPVHVFQRQTCARALQPPVFNTLTVEGRVDAATVGIVDATSFVAQTVVCQCEVFCVFVAS